MVTVVLYNKKECHLCEVVIKDLEAIKDKYPHRLIVMDIDKDPELQRLYGFDIPVIEVGPYRLKAPFNRRDLEMTLGAANDRKSQLDNLQFKRKEILLRREQTWFNADAIYFWLTKHYMAVVNMALLIYVGLPFLSPVLMKLGATSPALFIYRAYSVTCHQLAFRSIFLFGEQLAYPRSAANMKGYLTYNQVTGLSEDSQPNSLYIAHEFIGDETVGYKVALCQRDVAIWGSLLFFALLFSITRRYWKQIPWYLWLIFGLMPIGLDGMSQLISQPPFNLLPFRESTLYLRFITGGLFGFTTAWFGLPLVEETMSDSRRLLKVKQYQPQGTN